MVLCAMVLQRKSPLLKILYPTLPISLLELAAEPAPPFNTLQISIPYNPSHLRPVVPVTMATLDLHVPGTTKRRIRITDGCGRQTVPRCDHCLAHELDLGQKREIASPNFPLETV